MDVCGAARIRTADRLLAKQVLYQLSYNPNSEVEVTGKWKPMPGTSNLLGRFHTAVFNLLLALAAEPIAAASRATLAYSTTAHQLAPQEGLEPPTHALTAHCSTN